MLRFHRRWLNGAFETTLSNLRGMEEAVSACIDAYRAAGLAAEADLIQEAVHSYGIGAFSDEEWDALDNQYYRRTYGEDGNGHDRIEAALVIFAQHNADCFTDAVARANI